MVNLKYNTKKLQKVIYNRTDSNKFQTSACGLPIKNKSVATTN